MSIPVNTYELVKRQILEDSPVYINYLAIYSSKSSSAPKKQTFYIIAIAVGIVGLIIIGGLGIASLVQAHGAQIPHWLEWLTPLSQTQGAWGSWMLTFGGIAISVPFIAFGVVKIYSLNSELKYFSSKMNPLNEGQWKTLFSFLDLEVTTEIAAKKNWILRLREKTIYQIFYDNQCRFFIRTGSHVIPTIEIDETDTEKLKAFSGLISLFEYDRETIKKIELTDNENKILAT